MDLGLAIHFKRPITANEKGWIQIGFAANIPIGGDYFKEITSAEAAVSGLSVRSSETAAMHKAMNTKIAVPIIFKYEL
jgi:hypothetical protein